MREPFEARVLPVPSLPVPRSAKGWSSIRTFPETAVGMGGDENAGRCCAEVESLHIDAQCILRAAPLGTLVLSKGRETGASANCMRCLSRVAMGPAGYSSRCLACVNRGQYRMQKISGVFPTGYGEAAPVVGLRQGRLRSGPARVSLRLCLMSKVFCRSAVVHELRNG